MANISVAALRKTLERQERLELHTAIRLIRAGAAALAVRGVAAVAIWH